MKYNVAVNGKNFGVELVERRGTAISLLVGGEQYSVDVAIDFSPAYQTMPANSSSIPALSPNPSGPMRAKQTARSASGDVCAPMPGVIVSIAVSVGAEVSSGAPLLVMEAMKMENSITAPRAGKVSKILVKAGQQVEGNQILLSIE
jgi:glutaconyl-CoA decarboxylase